MPRDAAGISRPGMFSTLHDAETGLTFTPISGTAQRIRYRVSGNGANGVIDANTAYSDARSLAYQAINAGIAKPRRSDELPSLASRHW